MASKCSSNSSLLGNRAAEEKIGSVFCVPTAHRKNRAVSSGTDQVEGPGGRLGIHTAAPDFR